MIHADRGSVKFPEALGGPGTKAHDELLKAREHFGKDDPGSFKGFKTYKDKSVRSALEALFHRKCAYCEVDYATNQPVDIEHYRPKSGFINASDKLVKPGYWWLAADWDNLLPSCIDCNRRRKHETIPDEEESLGKANFFPIADEAQRWRKEGDEDKEVRLLLDPCRDRPEELLTFDAQGTLKAQDGLDETQQLVVRTSTKVYGLNRPGLATRRRSEAVRLRGLNRSLGRCVGRIKARPAGAKPSAADREELADVVNQILIHRQPEVPFTALALTIFPDLVITKLKKFVETHFATELGAVPAGSTTLAHFAKRFKPAELDDGDPF